MKRSWLTVCLVLLVAAVAALGIYREATLSLTHALTRFKSVLPPGAVFTYGSARPSFLVRGVTLRHVTFQLGKTSFHTRLIRLGHPQYLPNGRLSLSSLLLKDAVYTTPRLRLTLKRTAFHRLLVPPAPLTPQESDLATSSMRSLAAVMTFDPESLATLQFAQLHLEGGQLAFAAPTPLDDVLPGRAFGVHKASIQALTLDGYGLGTRVLGQAQGVELDLTARLGALAHLSPIAIPPALFSAPALSESTTPSPMPMPTPTPATKQSASQITGGAATPGQTATQQAAVNKLDQPETEQDPWRAFHVSLNWLNARDGEMRLLSHPFRGDSQLAQRFWNDPALAIWNDPGTLSLDSLSIRLGRKPSAPLVKLDQMAVARHQEGEKLRTEAQLRGFHLREEAKLPVKVNGSGSILRFSELSHATLPESHDDFWLSDITLRLNVAGAGEISLTSRTQVPRLPPRFSPGSSRSRTSAQQDAEAFARQMQFTSLTLSAKGDKLTALVLAALQQDRPDTSAAQIRAGLVQALNDLSMTRPLLAPLADYLLDPQNRTLRIEFGALTLHDLHDLPVDAAPDALLDALHVTGLTAHP